MIFRSPHIREKLLGTDCEVNAVCYLFKMAVLLITAIEKMILKFINITGQEGVKPTF